MLGHPVRVFGGPGACSPGKKLEIWGLQTAGNELKLSMLPSLCYILYHFKYFTIRSGGPFWLLGGGGGVHAHPVQPLRTGLYVVCRMLRSIVLNLQTCTVLPFEVSSVQLREGFWDWTSVYRLLKYKRGFPILFPWCMIENFIFLWFVILGINPFYVHANSIFDFFLNVTSCFEFPVMLEKAK